MGIIPPLMVASCFLSIQPKTTPSTNDTEEPLVRFAVAPKPSVGPGFPTPQVQSQVDWMQLLWRQPRRRVGSPLPLPQGRQHGHLLELMVSTAPGSQPPRTAPSRSGKKATGAFPRVSAPELGRGHASEMQLPSQKQATHTRGAPLQAALPNSPLPPMFWCPPPRMSGFLAKGVDEEGPRLRGQVTRDKEKGQVLPWETKALLPLPRRRVQGCSKICWQPKGNDQPFPKADEVQSAHHVSLLGALPMTWSILCPPSASTLPWGLGTHAAHSLSVCCWVCLTVPSHRLPHIKLPPTLCTPFCRSIPHQAILAPSGHSPR